MSKKVAIQRIRRWDACKVSEKIVYEANMGSDSRLYETMPLNDSS